MIVDLQRLVDVHLDAGEISFADDAPEQLVVGKPLALIGSARARDSRGYVDGLHRPGIPDNDV